MKENIRSRFSILYCFMVTFKLRKNKSINSSIMVGVKIKSYLALILMRKNSVKKWSFTCYKKYLAKDK